jgi:hypothetical protein
MARFIWEYLFIKGCKDKVQGVTSYRFPAASLHFRTQQDGMFGSMLQVTEVSGAFFRNSLLSCYKLQLRKGLLSGFFPATCNL